MYWTNNKTLNVPFPLYEYITLEFMTKNAIPEKLLLCGEICLDKPICITPVCGHLPQVLLYLISLSPILQEHIQSYIVLENEH